MRSQTTVPRANDESHSAQANDHPNQPSRSTEADRPEVGVVLHCGVTCTPQGVQEGLGLWRGEVMAIVAIVLVVLVVVTHVSCP